MRVNEVVDERTPPFSWEGWKAWDASRRRIEGAGGNLSVTGLDRLTSCPSSATTLYSDAKLRPRVCRWRVGRGTITLVQTASALSNARIGAADNLALLETLAVADPIRFDEWHQGFGEGAAGVDLGIAPRALLVHGGLLYGVVVWALSRPFGPVVAPLQEAASSTPRGRRVLGELHHRGGHAAAAGQRLIEAARARFVRRRLPWKGIARHFEGGEAELLEVARRIGQMEQEGREG
jgi:hypothetical protein